uniref:BAI1-associated protein 3 n=1 Tax=Acrobeloides nanus TaxID=290746 RepID=A0A914ELV1_9BILA
MESPLYSKCVIYQKSLDEDLNHVLRESANKYFNDKVKEFQNDESPCTEFHDIVRSLIKACHKFTNFDPIFKTYAGIDYCDITYREFDRLLNDYICAEMMSEKKKDLKTSLMSIPEDEHSLNMVLKVHFALSEFKSFRVPKQKYRLDNLEWDTTFDRAICKWMDIARTKAFARVDLACQLDAQIQITANEVRHTSSYVDICHIVEQMLSAWDRMEVKDVCLRAELTEKLVQCICKIAEYYIDRVMAQLATDGFCGQLQPFLPPALVNIFCAAINNCEQVRRTLIVGEKLRLDELLDAYKLKTHKEPKWRANIDKDLETCEKFIGEQIDCTIDRMSRRQLPQLKKHVFHLAWSPAACPVDQALKPLTDMLDAELSSVHRSLLHRNFIRVMHSQVNLIIQLLQECIAENAGLEPNFYQRLYDAWTIIMEFFHAGGKGISLETFENMPAQKNLVSQLSLNQMPTIKLIEHYYKDLLREQNEATDCKYGILNIRAYYNTKSQTLVVDVIGAKQIIPLDTNGLSDPFVVIELVPRLRYANIPVTRTKVVPKTLNPIFDETFEFNIPPKLPPSAMVHFVVMDHDFLRSNDFAGEALLDLSDVPGFGTAGVSTTLRQFNLVLIHPSRNYQNATEVLASRKEDKDAQEFVKSLTIAY